MEVTIKDIAKRANVSKTTVSRYLNGKYEFMSKETKKLISTTIEELDYRPNLIARSLKNKNSKIIGCVISNIDSKFSSSIFKGISTVCKTKGYRLLVTETNDDEKNEKEAIETLMSYNINGLIINTTGSNDKYLQKISKKIPVVLADRVIEDENIIDTVTSDNHKAVYNCMKYLKDLGYEKIGFFTYEIKNNSIRKIRKQSYEQAMKELFDDKASIYVGNGDKIEENIIKFLKENEGKRKAMFSINGNFLIDLLDSLKKQNIDYEKEDIGICSYDDWGWAEFIKKDGITTIYQDSNHCGRKCAKLLIDRIENPDKKIEYVELATKLIIRGSTTAKK